MLFSEAALMNTVNAVNALHEATRSVTSVKDLSHLMTMARTFDVVRNGRMVTSVAGHWCEYHYWLLCKPVMIATGMLLSSSIPRTYDRHSKMNKFIKGKKKVQNSFALILFLKRLSSLFLKFKTKIFLFPFCLLICCIRSWLNCGHTVSEKIIHN